MEKPAQSAIHSMTAFARARAHRAGFALQMTLRSVNARGLDIKLRLPELVEHLDPGLRRLLSTRLARGAVQLKLQLAVEEEAEIAAFTRRLAPFLRLTQTVWKDAPEGVSKARLDGLIALAAGAAGHAQLLEEETEQALAEAVMQLAEEALEALVSMRASEGAALGRTLLTQIDEMRRLQARAAALAAAALPAWRARLEERVLALISDREVIDAERLEQELALLAMRQDVREELDRLRIHLDAAQALLKSGGVIGRRLDFLAQELGREANTLTAKAQDPDLKSVGLALKNAIEQFREQVQNVE